MANWLIFQYRCERASSLLGCPSGQLGTAGKNLGQVGVTRKSCVGLWIVKTLRAGSKGQRRERRRDGYSFFRGLEREHLEEGKPRRGSGRRSG
jgi:hypothetical protein